MAVKRVLIFVDWFLPGFKGGGPIKSVEALLRTLGDKLQFDIITRDRDIQSSTPYPGIKANVWIDFSEGVRVCYLTPGSHLKRIASLVRGQHYSSIYVNSFFSFHFSVKIRLLYCLGLLKAPRFIIAPRGEMDPSRRAVKPLKKKIYLGIAKLFSIYKHAHWHSTSYLETSHIHSMFGASVVVTELANFSPAINIRRNTSEKYAGELRIIFISRIIPYKNLSFVLKVLTQIPISKVEKITLDIYGPIEDAEYWRDCRKSIAAANFDNIAIVYKGEVPGVEVVEKISNYHLFFFPTLGENFGHVIAESLLVGTPVLLSNLTPWTNLQENGAGWSFGLNEEEHFAQAIRNMIAMDDESFRNKVEDVLAYSKKIINQPETFQKYIDLLS